MTGERIDVAYAYGARADEYIEAVGRIEHVPEAFLTLVGEWARGVTGPLIDVGCGPGQWTHWLSGQGVHITGVDPVPEFIERARADYPDDHYRLGKADTLDVASDSLGGILAWYSLIHADAAGVASALTEFARCLPPQGSLLIGFFAGDRHEPFDHAVTTAYYWPVDLLASKIEAAGFSIAHTSTRTDPGKRTHGEIIAARL